MTKEVDEITVGANGTVWTAPLGTAFPVTPTAAPAAGWVDLGYTNEDGLTVVDSKTLEPIAVWQLFYPARRLITERDFTVAYVLRQWAKATVELAYGGATVTDLGSGVFRLDPPAPETIDDRQHMFDWVDGTKHYRLILPKGLVTENVESQITRTAAANLPITVGVTGQDGVAPWYLLTDDPAFDPTP